MISTNYNTIPTPPYEGIQSLGDTTKDISLRSRFEEFLNHIPENKNDLDDTQLETARTLKREILETVFSPEKLLTFNDNHRRNYKHHLSENELVNYFNHNTFDTLQRIKAIKQTLIMGKALEVICMSNNIEILDFLKKIQDLGDMIWDTEEVANPTEIHSLRLSINHYTLNPEIAPINVDDLLTEIAQLIEINNLETFINQSENKYQLLQSEISFCPTISQENINTIRARVNNGEIRHSMGTQILDSSHKQMIRDHLKNDIKSLKCLHTYLNHGTGTSQLSIMYGAEVYLNYIADEEKTQQKLLQQSTNDYRTRVLYALKNNFEEIEKFNHLN